MLEGSRLGVFRGWVGVLLVGNGFVGCVDGGFVTRVAQ